MNKLMKKIGGFVARTANKVVNAVETVCGGCKRAVAVGLGVLGVSSLAHASGSGSFPDITTVAGDATTLIASLIALGVTILAWKLGSRWIRGIVK